MIRFDKVSKRYDSGQEALSDVSFTLDAGEMAFLTGHSGAGKSTLLRLIMLMEKPSQGEVWIDSQNLGKLPKRHVPFLRRKFGVVHQNHQLLFDRSVFDNVALPLIVAGFHPRDIGRRVRAALDKVNLLHKERLNPQVLSGGEQQRVGIARAVVNKPLSCSPMSPPATSTRHSAPKLCSCSKSLIRWVLLYWLRLMTWH